MKLRLFLLCLLAGSLELHADPPKVPANLSEAVALATAAFAQEKTRYLNDFRTTGDGDDPMHWFFVFSPTKHFRGVLDEEIFVTIDKKTGQVSVRHAP